MSEQVERRLIDMLGNPTESPYGNPIPSLDDIGTSPAVAFLDGVTNVVAFARRASGSTATIRRLGEPVQFDPELLRQLKEAGIMPGAKALISDAGSYIGLRVDGFGGGIELPTEVAVHLFVAAV